MKKNLTPEQRNQEIHKYEILKKSKKCPHCQDKYWDDGAYIEIGSDLEGKWYIFKSTCPSCAKLVLALLNGEKTGGEGFIVKKTHYIFKPLNSSGRLNPPNEVPKDIATDYKEACLTIAVSSKASAALSRRCLQQILNEKSGMGVKDLAPHIEKVIKQGNLPTYISEALDYVRNVGNFAAHPIKSKSSGEIVSVEPGEAEWNLDVIELLFDFYFVQPEIAKQKKQALNKKLKDSGKPSIK